MFKTANSYRVNRPTALFYWLGGQLICKENEVIIYK